MGGVVSATRTLHVSGCFEGDGLCDVESKTLVKPILHGTEGQMY